jgi:ketosteroid isomerase-like protein
MSGGAALSPDAEAAAFFDAFVEAFRSFDGERIAQRYNVPYLAVDAKGASRCFSVHAEIGRYFQQVLDAYRAQGCGSCRYKDLQVQALGRTSLLATVTWELLGEGDRVISSWRESYTLVRTAGCLRVLGSVDHAG